jgi:hypothetical protein
MSIPLRRDFEASQLHLPARRSKDGPQARRLLALAAICDGGDPQSRRRRRAGSSFPIVPRRSLKRSRPPAAFFRCEFSADYITICADLISDTDTIRPI